MPGKRVGKRAPSAARASRKTRWPAARWLPDRARRPHRAAAARRREARAAFVDQHRALATHRFADQRHRIAAGIERGRMELDEFHIGELGTGRRRKRNSMAERAGRVGGMAIEIAEAAGREHDTVRRQQQRALAPNRGDAGDRFLAQDQAPRFDILEHGDRCRAPHGGDHRLQDRMAGAVAFGMDDAAAAMRGFEAEGEPAIRRAIETHAKRDQRFDRARAGAGDLRDDARIVEPIAGGDACRRREGWDHRPGRPRRRHRLGLCRMPRPCRAPLSPARSAFRARGGAR